MDRQEHTVRMYPRTAEQAWHQAEGNVCDRSGELVGAVNDSNSQPTRPQRQHYEHQHCHLEHVEIAALLEVHGFPSFSKAFQFPPFELPSTGLPI